jgi:hypothetical protein
MDDSYFGYKQKFLWKTLLSTYQDGKLFLIFSIEIKIKPWNM